jgi:dUTP pyrophosphatase
MRTSFLVPIELCHPDAKIPTYAHEGDAGVDLYLIEDVEIAPKATVIAKTGLKMAIPMGYELQIRPRSGTSLKTALRIANAPGTIDSTYRDEIGILAWNTSDELLTFKKGDRIAQGVLNEVPMMKFTQVDDITKIVGNRNGGYGSSGQ